MLSSLLASLSASLHPVFVTMTLTRTPSLPRLWAWATLLIIPMISIEIFSSGWDHAPRTLRWAPFVGVWVFVAYEIILFGINLVIVIRECRERRLGRRPRLLGTPLHELWQFSSFDDATVSLKNIRNANRRQRITLFIGGIVIALFIAIVSILVLPWAFDFAGFSEQQSEAAAAIIGGCVGVFAGLVLYCAAIEHIRNKLREALCLVQNKRNRR